MPSRDALACRQCILSIPEEADGLLWEGYQLLSGAERTPMAYAAAVAERVAGKCIAQKDETPLPAPLLAVDARR